MKQPDFHLIDFNDPKKIAAIIIFILAFFAFIWEIISGFHHSEQAKTENEPSNLVANSAPISASSQLFTTALFGVYVPVNLSDSDIKESMLDVQVVGIMYSSKNSESQVVLKVAGGKEKNYVVGDSLAGGAIIKRITKEGVVVLHNGVLESLNLPKNKLIFDAPAKPLVKE